MVPTDVKDDRRLVHTIYNKVRTCMPAKSDPAVLSFATSLSRYKKSRFRHMAASWSSPAACASVEAACHCQEH